MNWENDPVIIAARQERDVRNGLLRTALLWMPFFAITAAAGILFFFDVLLNDGDRGGTWFLVVVLTLFAFLFGFQGWQAVFDLLGEPTEMEGLVTRRWAKSDSLVLKSHYARIDGKILRGGVLLMDPIREGDRVQVRYYPHSAVIVAIERAPDAGRPP